MERELSAATLCALGLGALSCFLTVGGFISRSGAMIPLGSLAAAAAIVPAIYGLRRHRDFVAVFAIVLSLPGMFGLYVIATFLSSGK